MASITIPDIFKEKVEFFQEIGYKVSQIDENFVEMIKRKNPPFTFIFYLLNFPVFLPALVINWYFGYRFRLRIIYINENFKIETF